MQAIGQQTSSFSAKLQAKQQEQLDAVAALTQSELRRLSNAIQQQSAVELESILKNIGRLRDEFEAERLSMLRQCQSAAQQARAATISDSEAAQLKAQLQDQISKMHAEALRPMRAELSKVRQEAQLLARTTAASWLKPLLIGASMLTGTLVVAALSTLGIDAAISGRLDELNRLKAEIATAEQQPRLPIGTEILMIDGKRYITAPALGPRQQLTDGRAVTALE